MLRSVRNQVNLEQQDSQDEGILGLAALTPTGVLRPSGATWLHAVSFLHWLPAFDDSKLKERETKAVLEALAGWTRHLELWQGERNVREVAREAGYWCERAYVSREKLYEEAKAVRTGLERQIWYDQPEQALLEADLDRIGRDRARDSVRGLIDKVFDRDD